MKAKHALIAGILVAALSLTGCGKKGEDTESGQVLNLSRTGFGSICPYGTVSDLNAITVSAEDCKTGATRLELQEPPTPLLFGVDCKEMILTIRGSDNSGDSRWNMLPNGEFKVDVDGFLVRVREDGTGRGACSTYATAQVSGRAVCKGDNGALLDQAVLDVKVDWLIGQGSTAVAPGASMGARACQLPSSCRLHAEGKVRQCR